MDEIRQHLLVAAQRPGGFEIVVTVTPTIQYSPLNCPESTGFGVELGRFGSGACTVRSPVIGQRVPTISV